MIFVPHNATAEEEYRLTGKVTGERLERLLDRSEALSRLSDMDALIEEGMSQYPSEDFLFDAIERLHELAKRLRGDNKETLIGIIESLDDIAQTTFYDADYGRGELKKALEILKKAL